MSESIDNVKACLAPLSDQLVSTAAGDQLATLVAAQLGAADPAVLPAAVQAVVGRPEYQHFFKPTSPAPGSTGALAAGLAEQTSMFGGVRNRTPDGRINLAGSAHLAAVQPGTPNAQDQAAQVDWARLSPAERMLRLSEGVGAYRQAMANSTGIVLKKP